MGVGAVADGAGAPGVLAAAAPGSPVAPTEREIAYCSGRLVACVLTGEAANATEGAVGVFPGNGSTCAALGLPAART